MAEISESRRTLGIFLRSPVVFFLGLLWYRYLWWWIAGTGVAFSILTLVVIPIAFPFLYLYTLAALAFQNSGEPVLPGYWEGYPWRYVKWIERCIKLGFPSLQRWLLTGFKIE